MPAIDYDFNDNPAKKDSFGFATIAKALAEIIESRPQEDTPLTIGVYGPWGSGKTSLMRMLQDVLGGITPSPMEPRGELERPQTRTVTVWFDAWRYARHEGALWRALLICVIETIREQLLGSDQLHGDWLKKYAGAQRERARAKGESERPDDAAVWAELNSQLNELIDSLYRTVEREELGQVELDWSKAGPLVARGLLRIGLSAVPGGSLTYPLVDKAVEASAQEVGKGSDFEQLFGVLRRQRSKIYRDQIQSLEQFHRSFRRLVQTWFTGASVPQRLVLFIDDLDRCLPEHTVGVLEAIRVFFDIEGCVVVLGIDHDIVARGVRVHYKALQGNDDSPPIEGRDYLEKIIQIPIFVPLLQEKDVRPFIHQRLSWLRDDQGVIDEVARDQVIHAFYHGLPRNPRVCKRALNMLFVLDRLARDVEQRNGQLFSRPLLAKLVVLRYRYPGLYDYLAHDQRRLIALEQKATGRARPELDEFAEYIQPVGRANSAAVLNVAAPDLRAMLAQEPRFDQQRDEDVLQLLFLSSLLRSQADER